MQRRWLLLAVILTVPSGCDNVTWGGTEVRLQGPPARGDEAAAQVHEEAPAQEEPPDPFTGPILLAGAPAGDSVRLVVVGPVRGDVLEPLPAGEEGATAIASLIRKRLPPGTELVLFAQGARVGRLLVSGSSVDDRFCPPRPVVTGVAELVPDAAEADRFLALADTSARPRPRTAYRAWSHDYTQRVSSLSLASEAIAQLGAPWPPSLLESRGDIRAFRLPEATGPSLAATFLYKDRLAVAPPAADAYALFVIGEPGQAGYRNTYTWYRRADDDGKGVPRYFDHLDLDGDGRSEILLDVFGAERRWFASLARRNGTWERSFQDLCGAPEG